MSALATDLLGAVVVWRDARSRLVDHGPGGLELEIEADGEGQVGRVRLVTWAPKPGMGLIVEALDGTLVDLRLSVLEPDIRLHVVRLVGRAGSHWPPAPADVQRWTAEKAP